MTQIDQDLDRIVRQFGADSGTIHLLEADGVLHLKAATANIPPFVLDKVRLVPVGKGMAGLAVERNAPVNTCNIQTDTTGDVRAGAKATGLEGAIVVPIRRDGVVAGALGIANRQERTFTDEEIAELVKIAETL
jgi:L-methionine (R)-S-oxide reductase